MEWNNMRYKALAFLLSASMAAGSGVPVVYAAEDSGMANYSMTSETGTAAAALNDTFTVDGITYMVTKLPGTTANGQVAVTNGKEAEGNLVLKSSVQYAGGTYDITTIASGAFEGNTKLTGIDLSATSLSTMGTSCFAGCTELTSVQMPKQGILNFINGKSNLLFSGCTKLESLVFNSKVNFGTRTTDSPFRGSGLKKVTFMAFNSFSSDYAFNGVPDGFTVICPNELSNTQFKANVFGTAKNVTLVVPNAASKANYETVFAGKDVTVKLLSETGEESNVFVQGLGSELQGYKDIASAIAAINASEEQGPFEISLKNSGSGEMVKWEGDVAPNKETVIDFRGNSVDMPDTLTLNAALTIKNVTNFKNDDALCKVDAENYPFTVIDGGSFGFSEIKGNNITVSGTIPGSTPLGTPCKFIGTGENPALTISEIGRSDYYYNLPVMEGFAKLNLQNAYLKARNETKLENTLVNVTNGGLLTDHPVTLRGLSGNGEVKLEQGGSVTVTDSAEGTFVIKIPENEILTKDMIAMPKDATITLKDAFDNVIGDSVAKVDDGTTVKEYYSVQDALKVIENGTKDSYTLMLRKETTLPAGTVLPNKKLVINAYSYKLNMESGKLVVQNDLKILSGRLEMENAEIELRMADGGNHTVEFPNAASGKLKGIREVFANGVVSDTDIKISGSGKGMNLDIGEIEGAEDGNGKVRTEIYLLMCGNASTNPDNALKPDFIKKAGAVELDSSTWLSLSGDVTNLGDIRCMNTRSGLILTDDTRVQSFHFPTKSTTYLTQLTIPSGKKLSTMKQSEGNFKVTVTGTPAAGIFMNAAQSAASKIFCELTAPAEGMELVNYDRENGAKDYGLRAVNNWDEKLTATGWIENEMPKQTVSAKAKYGEVSYLYSDTKDGEYTKEVPVKAGTWYVKAVVAANDLYSGLESEPAEFKITEARKTAEVKIKNQPVKVSYTEGEKLDLTGLVVTLTDNYGKTVDVESSEFGDYGITVSKANGTVLTTKDHNEVIRVFHNGISADVTTISVAAKQEEQEKPVIPPVQETVAQVTSVKVDKEGITTVKLSWKKVKNATDYLVYRYNFKTKKYIQIKKTKSNTFTNTRLTPGTLYAYRIQACKTDGTKVVKGKVSTVVRAVTKPSTPSIVSVKKRGNKQAEIQVKTAKNVKGYLIYEYMAKTKKYQVVGKVAGNTFYKYVPKTKKYVRDKRSKVVQTVKGSKIEVRIRTANVNFKKYRKYRFKVRTYAEYRGRKVYSGYSKAKSVTR